MKKVKSGYNRMTVAVSDLIWRHDASVKPPNHCCILWVPDAELAMVYFGNEGGENTPLENIMLRGRWVSLAYYTSQVLLMLGYLRFQRLGWGVSLVVVLIVAALRTLSSGVAILTVAMVMGSEMVQGRSSRS
jgi:hypothetical protein